MSSAKPTRKQADLADVLEMVLDKGIVINADIAITVGETEMIGIELRAAIASFETAAEYGLAFPSGTDMRRVEQASGREPLEGEGETIDLGIEASKGGANEESDENAQQNPPRKRPDPRTPTSGDDGVLGDEDESESEVESEAENTDEPADAEEDDADSEAEAEEGPEES
ncbi:gas vesicle protein GvpJ [Halalkalicoccus salilacus]|uniref:gas vesicle protein GvpJ n=1 Tax=Halalkalicoccus salilacus TaxID=3117459 RepID=UPI00300EF468